MPSSGSIVQHYEIGERLGVGGMGEVYRARDTRLGRPVALKFISPGHDQDPDRRERLFKEAQAASLLRSPAVATTYDIGEDSGTLFIVMELVEGEALADRLLRGPLSIRQTLGMTLQIADALDEAHGLGIIHRDIKSANLVLDTQGRVKILDFGLAKFTGPEVAQGGAETMAQTSLGMVVGTASYMSPEQALGRPVDTRSDLFSLGVVVYESLTGRLPFDGDTTTAVIDTLVHAEPPALSRLNYDVTPRLEDAVRKLLQKAPEARYQSARELLVDLRTVRQDLEQGVGSGTSSSASGLSVGVRPVAPPPPANAVAVIPFTNITREPADDWIGSGIAETVTADLKSIKGLSLIGRERVFDALRVLGSSDSDSLDERMTIEVGRQLRATWLVSGGYQRLGDQIRITARFVEVESGAVVRTVKIDGTIGDIFSLQDKIVFELSQGMKLTLGDSEMAEIERQETESVEAYEYRSRAMMNIMEGSPQALDRAIFLLEKATDQDPNYAAAWAALALAYDFKGSFMSLPELSEKAVEVGRRATRLNPKLADARRWLGSALLSLGRFDEAIDEITEATRLEPDEASGHLSLARAYWLGRGDIDAGIDELELAIAINPDLGYAHLQLGLLYALRGNYVKAERSCLVAVDLQERFLSGKEGLQIVGANTRLGYVYYLQGRYPEAIQSYERGLVGLAASDHALKERNLIELHSKMAATYQRMDQLTDADRHFGEAVEQFERRVARGADDPATKYYIASLYGLRGDAAKAVRYLQETLSELPALNRARAQADPDFDPIRADPAFVEALAQATVVSLNHGSST
jgi:serine/threonine protein kinase/tetratricopeptide (TPR) repeat protein